MISAKSLHRHPPAVIETLEERNLLSVTLDLAAGAPVAYEGGSAGSFVITASQAVEEDLPVRVSIGGNARNGKDYQRIIRSVVIPAGSSSIEVPVNVIDDSTPEANKFVTLKLRRGRGYEVGNARAQVQVMDDEPHVKIFSDDDTWPYGASFQSEPPIQVTLQRTGDLDEALTVKLKKSVSFWGHWVDEVVIDAGKSMQIWTQDQDFWRESYRIIKSPDYYIEKGQSQVKMMSLGVYDPPTGSIIGTAYYPPYYSVLEPASFDPCPSVEVSVPGGATYVDNVEQKVLVLEGWSIEAKVTVSAEELPLAFDLHVELTVVGGDATDSDFEPMVLTIPAGQTSVTVYFTAMDDQVYEGPEYGTLVARLSHDYYSTQDAGISFVLYG